MRNARRLLAALLAVVMLIPSILVPGYAAETTSFKDVREDSWYADAVDYVSAAGYMKGTSKDAFSPGENVTRAMFVTILSRVARAQTDNTASAFGDVAANQYYSGAIEWAAEKEIVNGVGGGLFAPYRSITRQDLAVMLYRFVNAMGYELSAGESRTYTDEAAISAYAADAVRFVTSTGLFAGYQDGSFRPKATATRAQTAVIVMRLAQLLDGQIVDPEPMPAQSFDQTSEQMQVSVNAPVGALPENTKMTVSRVTDEAALAELASKVGSEVLGAVDISFAKDGAELEPARKVSVRISLDALQSAKNPAVVHVKDDGSFEYVSSSVVTTRGKADAIEFEADSFSVYAVVGGEGGSHTLTITFYARENGSTGAWKPVNKQIIRADQLGEGKSAIADPGVPNITTSQAFEGWIYGANTFNPDYTYTADTTTYSVKDINDYHNENPLTADTEIVCYAAVYDVVYITYHDQAGAIFWAEYAKKSGGSVEKMINVPYNPFRDNQHWAGWVPASYVTRVGDVNGSMPTYADGADAAKWTDGSTHTISANIDLYPYLEEGYWLYFDSNKSANNTANGFDDPTSADYTPPVFVAHGKNTEAPTVPTRAGYTFAGWYTDKNMTTPFTFGSALTAETVLYAKWTPTNSSYLVVFKVQDADNANDNDVSNNTYSYYAAVRRDWTWNSGKQDVKTGDTVSAFTAGSSQNDAYLSTGDLTNTTYYPTKINALGVYYQYSTKNNGVSQKVLGNGSTVLEVYYDRVAITFNFVKNSTTYPTFTELYGHEFKKADWPNPGSGNTWWIEDTLYFRDYNDPLPSFIPPIGANEDATTVTFYSKARDTSTNTVTYHTVYQDSDTLLWNAKPVDKEHEYHVGLTFSDNDEYLCYGYNLSSNSVVSSSFVSKTGEMRFYYYPSTWSGYVNVSSEYWIYFSPHPYTVTYVSYTSAGKKDVASLYGKHLKNIEQYVPTDGPLGSYFVGWYHDQSYQNPVDWENDTTPAENSTLYAKWEPMRFRVVCDPTDCGSNTDVSFSGNQTTMFVLNYGDTVDSIGLNSARSEGKILLGWYLDPECTKPYSFETHLTPNTEGMDMTYADSTSRTWTDPWDGGKTVTDGENVRGILRLYAKWRVDPEGVVGIKVRYLGDHAENDKGYFDSTGKPHEVTMDQVYTDQALAAAHSASVPSRPDADTKDEGRRFLYWEILDKYGNPTGEIVYPGAPFTIDINKAVEIKTPLPDPNCTHKDENNASTISPVDAVAPSCTETGVAAHFKCTKCGRLFTDAAGTNETTLDALTVSATGHDWTKNAPTYTWSVVTFDEHTVPTCTATVVCGNDETHKLTETVNGQLVVNGNTGYYLAEFEDEHFADRQSASFTVSRIAVTFKANGETIDELTQLVTPGQTVTLPGSEYLPAFTGYTFVGWVKDTDEVTDTTTAPAYKAPGETSDPINAPATFIALYTREQATGGNTTVYKRLTESPADWTGTYVITEGNTEELHALKTCGSGEYLQVADGAATLSDSSMTLIDSNTLSGPASDYLFNVSAVSATSPYYYIRNAKDSGYVSVYQYSSSTYYLNSSTSGTSRRWSLSMNGESVVAQNGGYTSYYLSYGVTSSNVFIFAAMTAAPSALYFWKETTVPATATYYTTTIPTWTVTYSVPDGVTAPEADTVVAGQTVTLPTAPEGTPEGYTFLGWVKDEVSDTTNAPAYKAPGETSDPITALTTFYALYSFVEGSGSGVEYNLVTEAPADWSGNYVITNNTTTKYVLKGVTGSASGTDAEIAANCSKLSDSGITQNGNVLTGVTDAYVFTLTANGSYYTVKSASTGSYYGMNTSSLLYAYSALNTNYTNWTPAINASGVAQLKCAANGTYPYFGFSTSYNYFWAASSGSADVLQLWKQTSVGTTYYTTNPANGGNAVTQPNLSSGKADSSAHLTKLSADGIQNSAENEQTDLTEVNPAKIVEAQPSAEANANRATHTYRATTTLTPGKRYLIGYQEDTVAAIMTPDYYSTSSQPKALVVSQTDGVITGDYDQYLFGVGYSSSYGYYFGNLSNYQYLYMNRTSPYDPVYGYNSSYPNYVYWTYSTSAKTLCNYGNSNRYLYLSGSNSDGWYFTTSTSGDAITFYELVEEVTGTNYTRTNSLADNNRYIIANDNHALGNTALSSDHFLSAVTVVHNTSGTESVTVSPDDLDNVTWIAESAGSSRYYLKNVATGQYLGYDSNRYLTVVTDKSSAYTWSYSSTDLSNNDATLFQSATTNYPYLFFQSAFVDFDTSDTSGRDIRLYSVPVAATTYTVTVASGITNGTVSADKATAAAGETVTLTVTPATGYELATLTVTDANNNSVDVTNNTFTMPAANVTVNATFTPSATPEPGITTIERWIPVDDIVPGEDYLIGFVLDGTTYLGLNYSPNTSNNYYYSYKFYTNSIQSSNSSYLGYTGTPIFDGVNITGVEGNTTDLKNATWTFRETTGGYYVVSKNDSNRYLYAKKGGSLSSYSNSLYWDQYPESTSNATANVWTWDKTNHHLYNTTNSVYAAVYTVSDSVYMSCMATDDDDYTDYIHVQLYKKDIINVYNVTLNPTENGTVRANKSTATAGETVTLYLTPNDGYKVDTVTVTASDGTQIEVPGANGRYHFTMPAANVTVTATFTNDIPDDVWVVSFVDEDGRDIPGMNDIYVPKDTPDNLPESALPDPAKEDYYFLGWYQGDTKCTFPMTVNSNIVLTPKYSPMYAYDYTLTLRAVYGPYNPDATTHIYWYANNGTDAHNGAGERYASEYTVTEGGMTTTTTKLPINAQVDIPLPTGNAASQTVFVGDNGGALTWEDHVFLGWARVDNGGTSDAAEARILTPDDIYLKWTGTKYMVRNDDGTYSDFSSQKVYADETTPYHDMYAVWAGFYYIYHSSDGKLEAVQVPFDARDTKDLVAEAESKNCLYGGYYKTSGAVVAVTNDEMRAAKDSILNQQNFWNYTDSCVASGSFTETSLTDEGAVVYNGTSVKHTVDNVTVPFWQKTQAYTELGTDLVPTAGTVYYLKEVPKTFLPNRLVYVKADKNTTLYDYPDIEVEEGKLTSLYLLTAVDDLNYAENGFMVGTANSGQDVTSLDGKSGSADSVSRVFSIILKNKPALHYNANALNDSIVVPEGMNPNLVGFVAAKHLDYNWIQAHKGQTADTATFYLKPYWTTLDGVTVTQDNIKGVNITADGKGISFVNVQ